MQLLQIWLLNQKALPTQTAEVWLCFRRLGVAGRVRRLKDLMVPFMRPWAKLKKPSWPRRPWDKHLPADDMSRLRDFFYSTDEVQEVLEVDGAVVTTHQLDDYTNRGDHPLLAPMTLYVYSMRVSRVELKTSTERNRQVVTAFFQSTSLPRVTPNALQ